MTPSPPAAGLPPAKKPLIQEGVNEWIRGLAIPGSDVPFSVLPPAAELSNQTVFTQIPESLLGAPIDSYLRNDPYPIPCCADREGYHGDRHLDWWLSGLHDFLKVHQASEQHGLGLAPGDRVFELGCASGRVLRHFSAQRAQLQTWGSDISLRHVEWVRQHLSSSIKIFQNTVLPHLPLEDNFFSVVSAFSVFSHIDEFELSWLAELRRILKPGGIAYLTIHSEHTWQNMSPEWPIYAALMHMRDQIIGYNISESFFQAPLPREKTVFRWPSAATYNTNVFHSYSYIKDAWGRLLDVVDIIPMGHNYQDVVILRKP